MDASNPSATTAKGYLGGTASFRTDLYNSRGTLLTLKESIALNKKLGVKHTPELKSGNPARLQTVFGGQEGYAQKMIDTFKAAGVNPKDVYAQSFDVRDVLYWIKNEPRFGQQAVYLDDVDPSSPNFPRLTVEELKQLKKQGVKIIAPPIGVLLAVNSNDEIVPSQYALDIKSFGFDIITWSFERADLRNGGVGAGFYYAVRSDRSRAEERQRHVQGAGRAGPQGRRHRHLLRLAGDRDLLRELHGIEVIPRSGNENRRHSGRRFSINVKMPSSQPSPRTRLLPASLTITAASVS